MKEQLKMISLQIKELAGVYQEAVLRLGISVNEFWIWYTLISLDGEHSQQDICKLWSLSKQTVNTIVSRMVQKGYVCLEAVPGTRNRKRILLTSSGEAYGRTVVAPITQAESRAIDELPKEDRLACAAVLGKYAQFLKKEILGQKA